MKKKQTNENKEKKRENIEKKTQIKQTLGIGFNYKFDNTPPKVEEAPATAFMQEAPIFEEKQDTLTIATNVLRREPILNETKLVTQ